MLASINRCPARLDALEMHVLPDVVPASSFGTDNPCRVLRRVRVIGVLYSTASRHIALFIAVLLPHPGFGSDMARGGLLCLVACEPSGALTSSADLRTFLEEITWVNQSRLQGGHFWCTSLTKMIPVSARRVHAFSFERVAGPA